jgi:hypothetical protein
VISAVPKSGGLRAAIMYTLIATAKLNDINPQTWLADVLARLLDHPVKRVHDLLPWNLASSERRPRCISAVSHPFNVT